jgi:hypothetical protein
MIREPGDGSVWLTISDFEGGDTVVHGVFTSKENAEGCAAEVKRRYPRRDAYAGEWQMNLGSVQIADSRGGADDAE